METIAAVHTETKSESRIAVLPDIKPRINIFDRLSDIIYSSDSFVLCEWQMAFVALAWSFCFLYRDFVEVPWTGTEISTRLWISFVSNLGLFFAGLLQLAGMARQNINLRRNASIILTCFFLHRASIGLFHDCGPVSAIFAVLSISSALVYLRLGRQYIVRI